MARHWITYSIDRDPRRRRGRQWRWPWNWGRGPRYGRPHVVRIQPPRQRVRGAGGRRRIWPWLLLLLLLLLLLPLGFLLWDDPEESGSVAETGGNGGPAPTADPVPADPVPADPVPGGGATPVDTGPGLALVPAEDGVMTVSVPDLPSLRLDGDATVMDLGDISCQQEHRYLLMSNGRVIPIDNLDDATVDALSASDVPIDTVALDPNVDTVALQAIATRTGGTFTEVD